FEADGCQRCSVLFCHYRAALRPQAAIKAVVPSLSLKLCSQGGIAWEEGLEECVFVCVCVQDPARAHYIAMPKPSGGQIQCHHFITSLSLSLSHTHTHTISR